MNSQTHHAREREVLLLAARPGEDPAARARLEQLLAQGIDWTALVRSALQHRLVPLLEARLGPIGAPSVPDDITQALGVWVSRNRDRNQVLQQAVGEISAALQGLGVSAVFLQGPPLAQLAYGNPDLQEVVNPTLLLRTQDLDRFERLATSYGYRLQQVDVDPSISSPAGNSTFHRTYVRDGDGSVISASTTALPASLGMAMDVGALLERAVDFRLRDTPLRTLSPEDLVLVWCASGCSREWPVLAEFCDLAWLLSGRPDIDLGEIRARARAAGVERLLVVGLALVRDVLRASIDAGTTGEPWLRGTLPALSAQLLADHASEAGRMAMIRRQVRLRDRFTDRVRYLTRTLVSTWQGGPGGRHPKADSQATVIATTCNKAHWSKRSDAWEKWSDLTRSRSAEYSRALISAAGAESGRRILDLACGVGDTSLELGPIVGPSGLVITTDLAFDMVIRARRRTAADGLTNLHFCTTAMESLPFDDGYFDGIVCRLGIMYCPQVQRALEEARRVLKAGARAAYLVCGPRDDNPILKNVHEVVTELFELEERNPVIDPFRFCAPLSLAGEMAQAGFVDVAEQDVTLRQYVPVGARFWQASLERGISLPFEDLPRDTRHELERRMVASFKPYLRGEYYELHSLSRITRGTCPG